MSENVWYNTLPLLLFLSLSLFKIHSLPCPKPFPPSFPSLFLYTLRVIITQTSGTGRLTRSRCIYTHFASIMALKYYFIFQKRTAARPPLYVYVLPLVYKSASVCTCITSSQPFFHMTIACVYTCIKGSLKDTFFFSVDISSSSFLVKGKMFSILFSHLQLVWCKTYVFGWHFYKEKKRNKTWRRIIHKRKRGGKRSKY